MTDIEFSYNYGSGHMIIHCDSFFPCTKTVLTKLLKLTPGTAVDEIADYLKEAEANEKNWMDSVKKSFPAEHQKLCDLQHLVDSKTHPNGIRLAKNELKRATDDLKEQKKCINKMQKDYKSSEKRVKQLQMNAEVVQKYKESMFW